MQADAVSLDEVIDVSLKGVVFLSQAFARAAFARQAGGAIVSITSLLLFQGCIAFPPIQRPSTGSRTTPRISMRP